MEDVTTTCCLKMPRRFSTRAPWAQAVYVPLELLEDDGCPRGDTFHTGLFFLHWSLRRQARSTAAFASSLDAVLFMKENETTGQSMPQSRHHCVFTVAVPMLSFIKCSSDSCPWWQSLRCGGWRVKFLTKRPWMRSCIQAWNAHTCTPGQAPSPLLRLIASKWPCLSCHSNGSGWLLLRHCSPSLLLFATQSGSQSKS